MENNLIYVCVFHQESYINLLKLLINSISVKANIDKETTDILIITSPSFQTLIKKELNHFDLPLQYYILDLHTIFEACCARLNIFNYENIKKYDNILYLDTDILLNSDVNVLFNSKISINKIYALEEGTIGHEYWGGQFFDFNKYDRNITAFTSGILLFRNSDCIKSLFNNIYSHIVEYICINNNISCCLYQPFIVYNAISQNAYDNQLLKKYVENNPISVSSEKIIYHFPGGSKFFKMNKFWVMMNELAFITLTNSGYIKYTLNCIQSLENIDMDSLLHSYVIGKEGFTSLKQNGYKCSLIDDEENSNFQTFDNGNRRDITFYKCKIIYENLLNYKYVCFTDGDIVFENKNFLQYLKNNIINYDMLVQSEGNHIEDFCSGFMYIKSNEITLSIFNPTNVQLHKEKTSGRWDDQIYLNEIRKTININYKKLPLDLFPTGNYYYNNNLNLSPYLIHFNWVVGDEKKKKMIQYGKWYPKIKICQYGDDGFGHQLEGMLRLISLSLNNKAEFVFDFRKSFVFEHSNFDINKLNSYLLKAFDILSNNSQKNIINKEYNVIYNETRSFKEIIKNDNYSENIYCYDGVGSGGGLPSNFEEIEDLKKSLSKLRKAFVLENHFLPEPTYKKIDINVVCHIRLGDAVGTRILDNDSMFEYIKKLQKIDKNHITIHSDGNIDFLKTDNTTLCDIKTDVLQVLSDFIHADILIINYSGLSISAHLLANDNQIVICPNVAGSTFFRRILDKCKKISQIEIDLKYNKKYIWENHSITFLRNGLMDAFGKGTYTIENTYTVEARFGGRIHSLVFNNDYSEFISTRKDDDYIVKGKLL